MGKKYRGVSFLAVSILVLAFVFLIVNISKKQTKSHIPIQEPDYVWTYLESPTGRCYEVAEKIRGTLPDKGLMMGSEIPCDEVPEGYTLTPVKFQRRH